MAGKFNTIADLAKFKNTAEILEKADRTIDILPAEKLIPYHGHPKIRENEKFKELADSLREHGILTPLQVRLHSTQRGYYEILSGHHRYAAGKSVGILEYPCVITEADDDQAACIVSAANKQNGIEDMLPSEIAWMLGVEYEALKHQGKRTDLFESENSSTSGTLCRKLSGDIAGEKYRLSERNVRYYIRLNSLLKPLLEMVDNSYLKQKPSMPLRAGVALSYLSESEQQLLLDSLSTSHYVVNVNKAELLNTYSQNKPLDREKILSVLSGDLDTNNKPQNINSVKIPIKQIKKYMPDNIEDYSSYILEALEFYAQHK